MALVALRLRLLGLESEGHIGDLLALLEVDGLGHVEQLLALRFVDGVRDLALSLNCDLMAKGNANYWAKYFRSPLPEL